MLRQKEARWAGFQFMMVYTNIIACYFSDRFQKIQNINRGLWSRIGPLLILLGIQVFKNILFQPLTKVVSTDTSEDKEASKLISEFTEVTEENELLVT